MVTDVVVVGGGVVGLTAALRLRQEGLDVTVLDAGGPGAGASPQAAGVLAPLLDQAKPEPLLAMLIDAAARWPRWLEEWDDAGTAPTLRHGVLVVAETAFHLTELRQLERLAQAVDKDARLLDAAQVRQAAPSTAASVQGGLFYPGAAWLDARSLYRSLVARCLAAGVRIRWGTPAVGFERRGTRVRGVRVMGEIVPGGAVILAAGAWSGLLLASVGGRLPIVPVRGILVELEGVPAPPWPVFGRTHHVVPRPDGTVLIGGVEEQAGFAAHVTARALRRVLEAQDLYPPLADGAIRGHGAGLRPRTPDGLPCLGWWPGLDGLFVAAGHFRNGILLAPLTAEIVTAAVTGAEVPMDLGPFRPHRFEEAP
jgi:glycine oxidase